ncbi:hypothetical protein MPD99_13085 [Xanthomonas citri pv. viticola]
MSQGIVLFGRRARIVGWGRFPAGQSAAARALRTAVQAVQYAVAERR